MDLYFLGRTRRSRYGGCGPDRHAPGKGNGNASARTPEIRVGLRPSRVRPVCFRAVRAITRGGWSRGGRQFRRRRAWCCCSSQRSQQLRISCRLCEECLSSNFINNLQHMVHDHITFVLRRKYSCDCFHRLAMSFLASSNGGLVFINSDKNPMFKHVYIFIARKLIRVYSPVHVMTPCDDPRPNRYVFRVSFENVVRPVTMAIPECTHGVGRSQAA